MMMTPRMTRNPIPPRTPLPKVRLMDPHKAQSNLILHGSQCGGLSKTGQFSTADFNQRIGVVECEAKGLVSVNTDS